MYFDAKRWRRRNAVVAIAASSLALSVSVGLPAVAEAVDLDEVVEQSEDGAKAYVADKVVPQEFPAELTVVAEEDVLPSESDTSGNVSVSPDVEEVGTAGQEESGSVVEDSDNGDVDVPESVVDNDALQPGAPDEEDGDDEQVTDASDVEIEEGEEDGSDPVETPEYPVNGWYKDPETGDLLYFVNGEQTDPDDVWYTDPETGERIYFKDGKETAADKVFYIDETSGARYWYENGAYVATHAFYDPATDAWYWADADGTVARDKDAFIPVDESNYNKGGKWVRINADYRMIKGEQYAVSRDDGQWHWWYFDPITGEMAKNFNYIVANGQGKWVYYDDIMGWMVYGQQYRPSNKTDTQLHWYYFDEWTGATQYRWKYIDGQNKTVYYDDIMGWMVYRWRYIADGRYGNNTQWHYFDRYTGALMTANDRGNSAHDCYVNIQGGSSKTPYYIVVDKDNFRTVIFQWGGNDWDVVQVFKCGLGRPSANQGRGTQEGFWYLGENVPAGSSVPSRMWRANYDRMLNDTTSGVKYRIHYIWDQGFHSTVYTSSTPAEQQLERYISDGCVRLLEQDAKWLWDHCANGTRVYIFRRY